MVIEVRPRTRQYSAPLFDLPQKAASITVFHCINALSGVDLPESADYELNSVKLPCSSLLREVVLLKAFESGADAVLVMVCPESSCRYLQGNLRAEKRVTRLKKMLDEIGIGGERLNIYSLPRGGQSAMDGLIEKTLANIREFGPSPVRQY